MRKSNLILLFFIAMILQSCGNIFNGNNSNSNDSTNTQSNVNVSDVKISWFFESAGEGDQGQPITNCYLKLNDKKVIVFDHLRESCSELTPDTYSQFKIPRTATSAFSSWWAGGGMYVYTQSSGSKIVVMRCYVDEGMTEEDMYKYESVKEIDLQEILK